jgi:hypothetical protein
MTSVAIKKYPYRESGGFTFGETWKDATEEVKQRQAHVDKLYRLWMLSLHLSDRQFNLINHSFFGYIETPGMRYRDARAAEWETKYKEAYNAYWKWMDDEDVHGVTITRYGEQSGEARYWRVA